MGAVEPWLVGDALLAPPTNDGQTTDRAARRIRRRGALPGSRAVVGALLMTVAAVGIYLAYTGAERGPTTSYAVAADDLDAGEVLDVGAVRFVEMDLPADVAAGAFTDAEDLTGRRLLAPLLAGDLVQLSAVSDAVDAATSAYEVSFSVPRAFAVNGQVRRGDLVDVYVTHRDERTELVASRVVVLSAPSGDDGAFADDGDQIVVLRVTTRDDVARVVHAARAGEVTLVRSTFASEDDGGAAVVVGNDAEGAEDADGGDRSG